MIDHFNDPTGWVGPNYSDGFTETGDAWIDNGIITILHTPRLLNNSCLRWHWVSMEKEYPVNFQPNTWIHFKFRKRETLIGADMYTTIVIEGEPQDALITIGINGEQHWQQFQQCIPKIYDDELFICAPIAGVGGDNSDLRVGFPAPDVRYSEWFVISINYNVTGSDKKWLFFVNGIIIDDIELDSLGTIDYTTNFVPRAGINNVLVSFSIMTDGDIYADTSIPEGINWRNCYAECTPAVPAYPDPQNAIEKNSLMDWDYLIIATEPTPDSDGDGWTDEQERENGDNPFDPDSPGWWRPYYN